MNSITIKPVIYAQYRKKDGTYTIRLRVTFASRSRFIATNLSAAPAQLTRGLRIKDAALQRKVDELVGRLRTAASRLNFFALQQMDVDGVVAWLMRNGDGDAFALDFPTYARDQIGRMGAGAKNYTSAVNSLTAFIGRDRYDIADITSSLLTRWQRWLEDKHGQDARAVSLYPQAIARLHLLARQEYNDEELGEVRIRNPFARYKCPRQAAGEHRNAPPAVVQMMLLWRGHLTGRERLGVDVFLLSFSLMGMNAPDLYECAAPVGGVLTYYRRKTRGRRADNAACVTPSLSAASACEIPTSIKCFLIASPTATEVGVLLSLMLSID